MNVAVLDAGGVARCPDSTSVTRAPLGTFVLGELVGGADAEAGVGGGLAGAHLGHDVLHVVDGIA